MAELRHRAKDETTQVPAPSAEESKTKLPREPDWGVWEVVKLVLMGLLWGAFVLLVAHGSTWLGRWWDNNVGTPGTPSWRRK
ncbi:hypothetical protein CVIRNUC_009623 [Coccomyxa viridis]|uniref:Uncharacterized protein n=1 Tax=Coccomyxa viridis TaxID=1274662 RepID=A0AAV1IK54_9CHLO|nr:hypothetical protein CVIRNUC_009623 [Coccomyxa viridis]